VSRAVAAFQSFQAKCIAPDAPDIQVHEMRMAFLAGFFGCLNLTSLIAEMSDSEALKALEDLHVERAEFIAALLENPHPKRAN
jgi:hypothetical protein